MLMCRGARRTTSVIFLIVYIHKYERPIFCPIELGKELTHLSLIWLTRTGTDIGTNFKPFHARLVNLLRPDLLRLVSIIKDPQ